MYCSVYRPYHGGQRIPADKLSTHAPRRGTLLFESIGRPSHRRRCILFGPDGNATIPPLMNAGVVKIDGKGIRINGMEVVSDRRDSMQFPQAWIVKQP